MLLAAELGKRCAGRAGVWQATPMASQGEVSRQHLSMKQCGHVPQWDKMVPRIPSSDFQSSDASKGTVQGAFWVKRF